MGFRHPRLDEDLEKEEYKNQANQTRKEIEKNKKTKNFNLRLSKAELDILKKEAAKNRRSMQQHIKHLLWNSFEPKRESETSP